MTSSAAEPLACKTKILPLYKVLLHNDDSIPADDVEKRLVEITRLSIQDAIRVTKEAHNDDIALIKIVHRELAELYQQQFHSCRITTTIEPE